MSITLATMSKELHFVCIKAQNKQKNAYNKDIFYKKI